MKAPFTEQEFLNVFGAYNIAFWPVVLITWVLAVAVIVAVHTGTRRPRGTLLFVAALWAWSGVAYHAAFFTAINPAASIFAGMFVFEAAYVARLAGTIPSARFEVGSTIRGRVAALLLIYASAYPVLVWLSGFSFPRAPLFAVPCPTVIFTAGILLAVRPPVSRWLYVVPVMWAVIGGSAALLFHMTPDLAMLVAGAAMAIDVLTARRTPRAAVA